MRLSVPEVHAPSCQSERRFVLHDGDLAQENPRGPDRIRILCAQFVLRATDVDAGYELLNSGADGLCILEVYRDGLEVRHDGVRAELHTCLLSCCGEVGIGGDHFASLGY